MNICRVNICWFSSFDMHRAKSIITKDIKYSLYQNLARAAECFVSQEM